MKNWDLPNKNNTRSYAVSFMGKLYRVVLFFPSHSCIDVKQALKNKIIDKYTFIIVVEKNISYLKEIKETFAQLGLINVCYHLGQADTLDLATVLNGRKIDYMFFDVCGNLTHKIANWFNLYQNYFEDNCRLFLTFSMAFRGKKDGKRDPKFIRVLKKFFKKTKKSIQSKLLFNRNINYSDNLSTQNFKYIKYALYFIFSTKEIEINGSYIYRDKTPMSLTEVTILKDKPKDKTFDKMLCSLPSLVYTPKKKRGRPRLKKVVKLSYAKLLHIYNLKDLKAAEKSAGKQAAVTRLANTNGTLKGRIWAGIRREITCMNRAA
jgi:hypothetical protein